MRISHVLVLGCSLVLGGCLASKQQIKVDQSEPHNLTVAQTEKIKQVVLSTLKDPYSAHFGVIKSAKLAISNSSQVANGYVVCGEINSKNSYGGYVGMTPFVGGFKEDLKEFKLLALGDQSGISTEIIRNCQQAGIIL